MSEELEVKDCKNDVIDLFGSKVFNITVMRKRLPKHIYKSMMSTIKEDTPLDENVAEVVANAMKDWALEQGATHFTHWFQPMTGITAEKHDAFISLPAAFAQPLKPEATPRGTRPPLLL